MKIGGPKGPPPVAGPQAPGEPTSVAKPSVSFEKVLADRGIDGVAAPELFADLAQQVRSGAMPVAEAADRLVDAVIARRGEMLPPAARERLRTALTRVLAEDPALAAALRRLEG